MKTINFDDYKFWYINKDAAGVYVGQNEKLDPTSHYLGETLDDYKNGAWILLSADQIAFKQVNPEATPEEVYNMHMTEPEPEPEPTPGELLQAAKTVKRQEVYNSDTRHYYLDGNDIYIFDRPNMKDKCSRKSSVVINSIAYPSNIVITAISEMADYDDECNVVTQALLKSVEDATTVEEVEAIVVTGYPDIINRTTEELQSAIDYKDSHDPEVQVMKLNRMAVSAMSMDDPVAITRKYAHAEWKDFIGGKLETGNRVLYNDWLWKVRQPVNPVLEIYPPSVDTAALYERIDENHEGTEFDPKLYEPGMTQEQGKYYTELDDGVRNKYYCFIGSTFPVYSKLKDLTNNVRLVH